MNSAGKEDHSGESDLKGEEKGKIQRAESFEREPLTEKLCRFFELVEIDLQPVSRAARKEVENII